mgnify:CR=1 FL=1
MTIHFGDSTSIASGSGLGGLEEADQWRITSNFTINNSDTQINNNWERNDTNFQKIGTGMSQSSGVFTFPSTGKWWCRINIVGYENELIQQAQVEMRLSTNSGSSYATVAYSVSNTSNDFGGKLYNLSCDSIIDVTNASTFRVRFKGYGARQTEFQGASDQNKTYTTWLKLGAT